MAHTETLSNEEKILLRDEMGVVANLVSNELVRRMRAGDDPSFSPNLINEATSYVMGYGRIYDVSSIFGHVENNPYFWPQEVLTVNIICDVAEMADRVSAERLLALRSVANIAARFNQFFLDEEGSGYGGNPSDRQMLIDTVLYLVVKETIPTRFIIGLVLDVAGKFSFSSGYERTNVAAIVQRMVDEHSDIIIQRRLESINELLSSLAEAAN
ncbi:MAG: hypothetical protein JWN28_904 [Candidatus Saccharibacteria bacterium]|nr:hypothetical protein [Candidatus Saccharibacteria bacterium]